MMKATSDGERRAEGWEASGSTSQNENRTSSRATRESAMRATSQAACRAAGQAARAADEAERQAAGIPSPDIWAGISADERAYRKRVLDDIARRVAEEGVHTAVPGDDRGRQFMPFAALKGYDDIVRDSQEPTR